MGLPSEDPATGTSRLGTHPIAISANVMLSRAYGWVLHPMDEASAKLVADGIIALFEPEE